MTNNELVIITLYFISSFVLLTSIGLSIFWSKTMIKIEDIGASFMIGLGIAGYVSFVIGLLEKFNKTNILIVLFILFILSLFKSVTIVKKSWKNLITDFKKSSSHFSYWLFITPVILILGSLYLTSMQPPYTSDELHYHFPQAMQIVNSQKINIDFGGHYFYGNIPKLMEVIFAMGISIYNFSFAHLLNFSVFVSFLLILYGIIKKYYGQFTSIIIVLLILLFDDFTWNATSGYVDSATVAFEISSLLFFLIWLKSKQEKLLLISGSLIGISLSLKYSPVFTAIFIVFLLIWKLFKTKDLKIQKLLYFLVPVVLFAGYWYIKNLIFYLNPFYPLYFGHKDVPEIQYKSLIDAIQEFGSKTLGNFFNLIGRYKTLNGIFVYISFFIPLIIPFIKRRKWPDIPLFIYYISYCFYWFLFATHQIRFLAPAIIIAIILSARVFSIIKLRYYILFFILSTIVLLLFNQKQKLLGYRNDLINTKLHLTERQYALGNETKSQFLNRHFGCQYSIIEYLENNNLKGNIIDNWSVWHAPSVSFYAQKNKFVTFGIGKDQTLENTIKSVKSSDIKFIYFNTKVRSRHFANTDSIVVASKNEKLPLEEKLLKYSTQIYNYEDCYLYKINYDKL